MDTGFCLQRNATLCSQYFFLFFFSFQLPGRDRRHRLTNGFADVYRLWYTSQSIHCPKTTAQKRSIDSLNSSLNAITEKSVLDTKGRRLLGMFLSHFSGFQHHFRVYELI